MKLHENYDIFEATILNDNDKVFSLTSNFHFSVSFIKKVLRLCIL